MRRESATPRGWQISALAATGLLVGALVVIALQPRVAPSVAEGYVRPSFELAPVSPTVVFIGDSYTGGSDMGGRGEANWTAIASDALGWSDCSFAVGGSGWTVGAGGWTYGARVDWALSMNPSLIVFSNGINDVKGDPSAIGPSAAAALDYLRSQDADVPVVVVGPALVQDFPALHVMNDGLFAAASGNGVTYIDAVAGGWLTGDDRVYVGSDQFHPTDDGHVYLAEKFADSIRDSGIKLDDIPHGTRIACDPPSASEVTVDGTPVQP